MAVGSQFLEQTVEQASGMRESDRCTFRGQNCTSSGKKGMKSNENEDGYGLSVIRSFFILPGIICAEGNLWRDQRRLSTEWLRTMGMTKFGPTRATLEARILIGVNELLEVLKFLDVRILLLLEGINGRTQKPSAANDADPRVLFVEFLRSISEKNGF